MSLTVKELSRARDTVADLLEELNLDAYLFEVEPKNNMWEIKIECAIAEGWQTATLSVDNEILLASLDDRNVHQQLIDEWQGRLSDCKIRSP